jgi:hypothetical protein
LEQKDLAPALGRVLVRIHRDAYLEFLCAPILVLKELQHSRQGFKQIPGASAGIMQQDNIPWAN